MSYIRHKSQKRDLEIGFFQMQILLFLHGRDYYGYELLEELHMSGRTQLSSGSLYPTLRSLEKKGYIKGRHEESSSTPDRRIYSITQKGRGAIDNIFLFFIKMFSRIIWYGAGELKDLVIRSLDIREGETVADFGEAFGELPVLQVTPESGYGYFFVTTAEEKTHVERYFKKKGIHNIVPLLSGKDDPPAANVAFYDFFHHSLSPKEDIERMVACLKSGGRLIIIDMFYAPQVASLNDFFRFRFPRHEHVLDEESVKTLLREAGLIDIESKDFGTLCIIKGVKP
jgi:PadR family transcriptional regulator PadR